MTSLGNTCVFRGEAFRSKRYYYWIGKSLGELLIRELICFFIWQSEPERASMTALIQKLHLCVNQLEQVNDV